jgi:hypothetical protein
MDELIALRKELELYKDLTERELQLKQRKLENSESNNNPYSMAKLKTLSLPQVDHLKAIMFLKGDREAREIFKILQMLLSRGQFQTNFKYYFLPHKSVLV